LSFADQKDFQVEIRELSLRRLAEAIGSSKKTRKLEIDYTMWRMVRDMGGFFPIKDCYEGSMMFRFMREEMKRLRFLEALKLILMKCFQVRNLRELSDGLRELTSLKSLDLDLYQCENLTDEGLKDLGDAIRRLISLKSIKLNVTYCSQLTDLGFEEIGKALRTLNLLEELSFNMRQKVTDLSLKSISEGLKRLVCLRTLNLEFA